ncbi:MAG: hypothetical protein LBS84_08950, partial [Clostridiales bacterium]|nr:hypothetical protein [Clostridiales bacterium]
MKRLLLIYALALTGASVFLFLLAAGLSYDLRVCGVIIMLLAFLVSIPLINHLIARTFESVNMLDLSRPVFDELSTLIFQ